MIEADLAKRPTPFALIHLEAPDGFRMTREAAQLYEIPRGLGWVEPHYLDPNGAATPAVHAIHGITLEQIPEGYAFTGRDWFGRVEFLGDLDGARVAGLAWYAGELERTGRRVDEEHERLRDQVLAMA